ncbi:MAG: hypothetical protein ABJ239_03210 [Erythrobacter sp.]
MVSEPTSATGSNTKQSADTGPVSWSLFALAAFVLVALQVELAFHKSINWDEFFHLSQIHTHLRGEAVQWQQTPHVPLFSWVPSFVSEPIDQAIWIRLMLLPCGIITAIAIWLTARRFTDNTAAAVAAIAWFGAGYVFMHSFALRADMIAAMLLTLALCAIVNLSSRWLALIIAALLAALAFIATMKSLLYLPAFAAVVVWRLDLLKNIGVLAICAIGAITVAGAIYMVLPSGVARDIVTLLEASARRMFDAGIFPNGGYFLVQLATAPAFTAMIIAGLWAQRKADGPFPWWLPIGLALPLLSVVIYRNSYPYFYAFILPPVAIAAAWGVQSVTKRYSIKAVLLVTVMGAGILSLAEDRSVIDNQRIVHAGIAEIFPEKVPYIDDVGFRPDYPRAVPHFASGWSLEVYRENDHAMYDHAIETVVSPMLLRQGYALEQLQPDADDPMALLPEDTAALRDNYLQHWGMIFVAGKRFEVSPDARTYQIKMPGIYTLEGGAVTIDGTLYEPGDSIELKRGAIEVGPIMKGGTAIRWGDNLAVPETPFPQDPLFTNY